MLNVDVLIRALFKDKLVRVGCESDFSERERFQLFCSRISDLGSNGHDLEIFVPETGSRSASGSANTPAAPSKQAAQLSLRAAPPALCFAFAHRVIGAEHPTTVYVGCGDLWTWNVIMGVECNPLMHSEIRKVRAAKGEHALRVRRCVLMSCVLGYFRIWAA